MHANFVHVEVDAARADAARTELHEQVVPRISAMPGFVAGYWTEPIDGKGLSVTLWGSEQAAREAAGVVAPGSSPAVGVTVENVETREVIAQA